MTERNTQAAYDRIAPLYAQRHAAMIPELAIYADRLLELAGPEPKILDVGCGAGRDMAWMEACGAQVTGVDLSAGMLAEARQQVRGPLVQMDMRALTFMNGEFDGVWCTASLLHLPKAEVPGALGEMWRVLRPGGPLFLGIQEGEGEGWEVGPYAVPAERFFARYRQAEAEEMLVRAGFGVLEQGSSFGNGRRWLHLLAEKLG